MFSDFNLNRTFDGNDRGLAGFTVNLSGTTNGGGSVVTSAVTDANGSFQFTGLEAGKYTLDASQSFFNPPVGLSSSFGGSVNGSAVQNIIVGQGQSVSDVGFAVQTINPRAVVGFGFSLIQLFNVPTTTIIATAGGGSSNFANNGDIAVGTGTANLSGIVYNDHSAAGVQESGDLGVAGVTVRLNGQMNTGASITKTAVTGADGSYTFTSLPAGTYFINVVTPNGFRSVGANVGNLGGTMTRTDQLSPTILTATSAGTGYSFGIQAYNAGLQAFLANNDVSNDAVLDGFLPTVDASIRGKVDDPTTVVSLMASLDGAPAQSILDTIRSNGTFYVDNDRVVALFGAPLLNIGHTVTITSTDAAGQQSTVLVKFRYTGNGPTFLAPLPNITGAHGGTSTIRLAGAFTDPAIQNSQIVANVLEGNTLVHIPIELFDRTAPGSVSNFFSYFSRYDDQGGTVVHRAFDINDQSGVTSLQGIQAGGYFFDSTNTTITAEGSSSDVPVRNEYSPDRPNVRGTLSMAKPGSAPDGATDEFFVNTADVNGDTLDIHNTGGFSVFGKVVDPAQVSIFDDMLAAPNRLGTVNPALAAANGGALNDMPLLGNALSAANIFRFQSFDVTHRDNTLTYSIVSTNTSVVAVGSLPANSFQGDLQNLSFVAAGTSTITVTVTDTAGNTAKTSFVVTVT